jgi:hypothetical protein
MANYRCPICGANHKEPVESCRLCGADMTGRPIPAEFHAAPPPVSTKGGVKGIVFIGLGVVLLLGIAGLAFGFIRSNEVIEQAKVKVLPNQTDGWRVQNEPDPLNSKGTAPSTVSVGHFSVELPGDPTYETIPFGATNEGNLTVWTAKIGTDYLLQVGWGHVTPPAPGVGPTGTAVDQTPTGQRFLKETVAPQWLASHGVTATQVTEQATVISGAPAYVIKEVQSTTTLNGKPAFLQTALILHKDILYVIQLTSIYKDADQLDRMINSFTITA